jgi:hypothetical protein
MPVRVRFVWILSLAMCTLTACGDDDDSGPSDSGADPDGGGGGGGDGDGDGDAPCGIAPRSVTEPEDRTFSNLSVAGDTLVFLAADPATSSATIEAVGTNGEGRQTLHTPTSGHRFRSVLAHDDTVYFLQENDEIVSTHELFTLPLTGGTPAALGPGVPDGHIFGIDDTHLFTVRDAIFERIALTDGSVERVGSMPTAGTPLHVQLSGDHIFFDAGMAGTSNPHLVYRLDKTATDAAPEVLWDTSEGSDPCYILLGNLLATPTKLVCGYFDLATRNRDGTNQEILFDGSVLTGTKVPMAVDGETVYVGSVGEAPRRLTRMTSAGEDEEVIVCDTGSVGNKRLDGYFPIINVYEFVVGATELFWVETDTDSAEALNSIRRATK